MELSNALKITTDHNAVPSGAQCISYEEWCREYESETIHYKLGELINESDVEDWQDTVERIENALCSIWEGESVYFWIK